MTDPTIPKPTDETVAVIMPAWNAASTVELSIRSALAQSHSDLRIIVSDDGSTDGTPDVVRRLQERDERVVLLQHHESTGPACARNRAIESAADCRWLAFLDSDDVWHPNKISRQLQCAGATDAGLVYTAYWRMSSDLSLTGRPVVVPASIRHEQLVKNTVIATSTVLLDRERTGEIRLKPGVGYDDFELWTRLLRSGCRATGLREPLMCYRILDDSVSSKKTRMSRHTWRLIREQPGFSFVRSAWCYANYAVRAALKHRMARPRYSERDAPGLPFDLLHDLKAEEVHGEEVVR